MEESTSTSHLTLYTNTNKCLTHARVYAYKSSYLIHQHKQMPYQKVHARVYAYKPSYLIHQHKQMPYQKYMQESMPTSHLLTSPFYLVLQPP